MSNRMMSETDTKNDNSVSEQYIRQGETMLTDLIGLPLWRIKVGDKFGSLAENTHMTRTKLEQDMYYTIKSDIVETQKFKKDMPKELYEAIIQDLYNSEIWTTDIQDNKLIQHFYKSYKELDDNYGKKHK